MKLSSKHLKTLHSIYEDPIRTDLDWKKIEALFSALGAEISEDPDKPFSGRLMLRLPTDVHRKVYTRAQKQGKSLNEYITEQLSRAN